MCPPRSFRRRISAFGSPGASSGGPLAASTDQVVLRLPRAEESITLLRQFGWVLLHRERLLPVPLRDRCLRVQLDGEIGALAERARRVLSFRGAAVDGWSEAVSLRAQRV